MKSHLFHLVNESPWPLIVSIAVFGCVQSFLYLLFHLFAYKLLFNFALITLLCGTFLWWRDVSREGAYEGQHTSVVQIGLRMGFVLFIVSEIMFFSSFFWGFFHSSLAPSVELGSVWPPRGIQFFYAWDVPFLNTVVLLLSGSTITWAHFALAQNLSNNVMVGLYITILLAIFFTFLQAAEYSESTFSFSDSVYGSIFFMATGFHGFHVIIGTIFIIYTTYRIYHFQLSAGHHVGFLAASWYWHFVDVVWLFLFIAIYWWGNTAEDNNILFLNILVNPYSNLENKEAIFTSIFDFLNVRFIIENKHLYNAIDYYACAEMFYLWNMYDYLIEAHGGLGNAIANGVFGDLTEFTISDEEQEQIDKFYHKKKN